MPLKQNLKGAGSGKVGVVAVDGGVAGQTFATKFQYFANGGEFVAIFNSLKSGIVCILQYKSSITVINFCSQG